MQFEITLGNTETRKGHRRDCAQLEATFRIEADTEAAAVEVLEQAIGVAFDLSDDVAGLLSLRLDTNPANIAPTDAVPQRSARSLRSVG